MCEAHIIPVYMYIHTTHVHYDTIIHSDASMSGAVTRVRVFTYLRTHARTICSGAPCDPPTRSCGQIISLSSLVRLGRSCARVPSTYFFYNIIIEPITFGSRSRTPHIILLYTIITIITPVTHIPSVRYSIYTYVYRSCSSWTYVFYVQFFPETSSAVYTMTPGKRFRYDICLPTSIGFMRLIWSEGRLILLHLPVIIIYLTRLKIMLSEI